MHGRIIPLVYSFLKSRSARIKVNQSWRKFFTPFIFVPQGVVLSPLLFLIFLSDFLKKNYETINMLMLVRAHVLLLNLSRSMKLPKSFAKPGDWSLNVLKQQMLFNTVKSSAKYSITDVAKVVGVQLDPQLKFRSHFNHLTAFNLFTWNNFKCILNRGIKPTSRSSLFNVYYWSMILKCIC